jgi:hypothetical protein
MTTNERFEEINARLASMEAALDEARTQIAIMDILRAATPADMRYLMDAVQSAWGLLHELVFEERAQIVDGECIYCGVEENSHGRVTHEPECIVARARAWMEEHA